MGKVGQEFKRKLIRQDEQDLTGYIKNPVDPVHPVKNNKFQNVKERQNESGDL